MSHQLTQIQKTFKSKIFKEFSIVNLPMFTISVISWPSIDRLNELILLHSNWNKMFCSSDRTLSHHIGPLQYKPVHHSPITRFMIALCLLRTQFWLLPSLTENFFFILLLQLTPCSSMLLFLIICDWPDLGTC